MIARLRADEGSPGTDQQQQQPHPLFLSLHLFIERKSPGELKSIY